MSKREEKNDFKVFLDVRCVEDLKALHMSDIVSCQCQEHSCIYTGLGDQIWSPAWENLKAVVLQNDIHEKQWNRVALDQSNDDPAGRAEQLKESPGERWELLTATEYLHPPPLSLFPSLSLIWG